jgi:hypothetical protein
LHEEESPHLQKHVLGSTPEGASMDNRDERSLLSFELRMIIVNEVTLCSVV